MSPSQVLKLKVLMTFKNEQKLLVFIMSYKKVICLLSEKITCSENDNEAICHRMALICGTSTCHMVVSRNKLFIPGVWGPFWSGKNPKTSLSVFNFLTFSLRSEFRAGLDCLVQTCTPNAFSCLYSLHVCLFV